VTLFNIIAVYNEEVIFEKKQVGVNESNAVFKSGLYAKLNELGIEDLDDVDIKYLEKYYEEEIDKE
jgi:hypothetical protein